MAPDPGRRRSARLAEFYQTDTEAKESVPSRDMLKSNVVEEKTSIPRRRSARLTEVITFPFLNLSAELRNRVYSMALCEAKDGYDSNLAALKFPPITRASRQLRQESLAFLFAERNFVLYVGSDLTIRSEMRKRGGAWLRANGSRRKESSSQCGTLGFKNIVSNFIKGAGASALFRDITFEVYPGEQVKDARYDRAKDPVQEQRGHARY